MNRTTNRHSSVRKSHKTTNNNRTHKSNNHRHKETTTGRGNLHSSKKTSSKAVVGHKKSSSLSSKLAFAGLFVICFIAVFTISNLFFAKPAVVNAEEQEMDLQYKLVKVEYGDTLWSIADEYMTPDYSNVNEYVEELRTCNQLHSDQINQGSYLMIPYYDLPSGSASESDSL